MAANLSELAYAARDMNRAVLAAGGLAVVVLAAVLCAVYLRSVAPLRHGAGFVRGVGGCGGAAGGSGVLRPLPAWAGGLPPTSC